MPAPEPQAPAMVASDDPRIERVIDALGRHIEATMTHAIPATLAATTRVFFSPGGARHDELRVIIAAAAPALPYTERVLRTVMRHGAAAASDAETALAEIEGRL